VIQPALTTNAALKAAERVKVQVIAAPINVFLKPASSVVLQENA